MLKTAITSLKEKVNTKLMAFGGVGAAVAAGSSVMAFAATEPSEGLEYVAITTEMLDPLVDGVVANVNVILPVGLGLFAIFLGIRIIPRLINRFVG